MKNDSECLIPKLIAKQRNQQQQDLSNCGEYSKFIEDQMWGFRITGGAEFGMPITVFHVRMCCESRTAVFFYLIVFCFIWIGRFILFLQREASHYFTCMRSYILVCYEKIIFYFLLYFGYCVHFVYFYFCMYLCYRAWMSSDYILFFFSKY